MASLEQSALPALKSEAALLSPFDRQSRSSIVFPIGCGVLIAVAVALRAWIVVAALLIMPLVMLAPVEFAFGLLVLAVYFDDLNPFGGGVTPSFIAASVSGAILLLTSLAGRRWVYPSPAAGWFVLLFFWTMMSSFWAMHSEVSFARVPSVAALGVLYLIGSSMRVSEREFKWVTRLIVCGGCIASAVSLYQFAHGIRVSGRASIVFGSAVTNPNELAITILLPLSLGIGLALFSRGVTRVFFVIASMLLLVSLILTMSRGGLVAFGVLTVVYIYRMGLNWRVLVVIILALVAALFAPALLMTRVGDALSSRAQGRFDIWLVGLEIVKHHGVFGVGLDNFSIAFQRYAGHQAVFHHYSLVPHNIYLQALAETGVGGLSLLLGALIVQAKQMFGGLRRGGSRAVALVVPCEAAVWSLMTHAMVANVLWRKIFWFVCIVAALSLHVERPVQEREGGPN